MKPGSTSWTLSPSSESTSSALFVGARGYTEDSLVYNNYQAWPAVFLKSDVSIASGDGTSTSTAYVLDYSE